MNNQAEFGDMKVDGSKANGSERPELAAENQSSGNGLVHEFSKITDPKVLATGGGGDKPDAESVAASPESGSGIQKETGLVGIERPVTSSMDSTSAGLGEKSKQSGSSMKEAAGELGKYKSTGVSGAFPSSAELLRGLKG